MIKVYVRAIVHYKENYVLMSEPGEDGKPVFELPGGELIGGKDVKEYLKSLVLENVGYEITGLRFYEVVCKVRRRARGVEPMTIFEFVFTCRVETASAQPPLKEVELLPYANFEWLASDGKFHENKIMSLLGSYHHKLRELEEAQMHLESTVDR